jgi:hypothetical protein
MPSPFNYLDPIRTILEGFFFSLGWWPAYHLMDYLVERWSSRVRHRRLVAAAQRLRAAPRPPKPEPPKGTP